MSLVKEAFEAYANKRRPGFHKDREKTVGASEIGLCARKVWYQKHGDVNARNPEKQSWGAARRGSVFEMKFFVPAMRKRFGEKLLFAGGEQKKLLLDPLSATPDGLLVEQPRDLLAGLMVPDIGPSHCVVVEAKTIDPRIGLPEAKPEHVFQTQVQMGLFRRLTKYKPDFAVIIYTNASFYDDVVEFVVQYDDKVFELAQRRADRIMLSKNTADLKPEGWIAGGSECRYCPWSRACVAVRNDVHENRLRKPDSQFLAELSDLARAYVKLQATASSAGAEVRNMGDKIRERLREKGLRKVDDARMHVLWSAVKGRISYDMPAIRQAAIKLGLDIQLYETVGEPSDQLVVQVLGQDRLVKSLKFPE